MENLQYVIQQLLEKDIEPGTYQISDDVPLSTNQLIELIAASKDKKAKIWNINKNAISSLAKLGDLFHVFVFLKLLATCWNKRFSI